MEKDKMDGYPLAVSSWSADEVVAIQNVMTRLRLLQPVMYAFVLFRRMPTEELRHLMEADGYTFRDLPKHPYAT